jgi:hypothetical protein
MLTNAGKVSTVDILPSPDTTAAGNREGRAEMKGSVKGTRNFQN